MVPTFPELWSRACVCAKSLQLCLTLCDPMDCTPPGSSVHGIFQARILEWVTRPFSSRSSQLRDRTCISYVSCIGRQVLYHYATWEAPRASTLISNHAYPVYISHLLSTVLSMKGNQFLECPGECLPLVVAA